MHAKKRSLAVSLSLFVLKFVFFVFIGLILAEGLFRLWRPPGRFRHDRPRYLIDYDVKSDIRDKRNLPPHEPDVFRVFVVGDSYTWGANNQYVNTYPAVLEWLLNTATRGKYEVYNYGVNGATTEDELRLMKKIVSYQPDLIIMGYFLNDPDPNRNLPPALVPFFQSEAHPSRVRLWLERHFRLYRFLYERIWAYRMVRTQIEYFHQLFDPQRKTWPRHVQELRAIARFRDETGIPVLVVIWPHLGFPLNKQYPFRDIHEQVYDTLRMEGLPVIDLLRYMEGMDHQRLQAVPALDPHPSEIAHRLAAEIIFDWMVDSLPRVSAEIVRSRLKPNSPYPSFRLRLAPLTH